MPKKNVNVSHVKLTKKVEKFIEECDEPVGEAILKFLWTGNTSEKLTVLLVEWAKEHGTDDLKDKINVLLICCHDNAAS
jgi:hypothetical protein